MPRCTPPPPHRAPHVPTRVTAQAGSGGHPWERLESGREGHAQGHSAFVTLKSRGGGDARFEGFGPGSSNPQIQGRRARAYPDWWGEERGGDPSPCFREARGLARGPRPVTVRAGHASGLLAPNPALPPQGAAHLSVGGGAGTPSRPSQAGSPPPAPPEGDRTCMLGVPRRTMTSSMRPSRDTNTGSR